MAQVPRYHEGQASPPGHRDRSGDWDYKGVVRRDRQDEFREQALRDEPCAAHTDTAEHDWRRLSGREWESEIRPRGERRCVEVSPSFFALFGARIELLVC